MRWVEVTVLDYFVEEAGEVFYVVHVFGFKWFFLFYLIGKYFLAEFGESSICLDEKRNKKIKPGFPFS